MQSRLNSSLPYVAWTIALASTVGSLFFSEVMQFAPCVLCWYQRIAMYPLVLIIATGILLRDKRLKAYALPFSNAVQIEWLGFITIPMMGLAAFLSITLCLLIYRQGEQ